MSTTETLIGAIRPLLAGHPPHIQGAVLAYLTGLWLAGHWADNEAETKDLRESLLAAHIAMVRDLTVINAAFIFDNIPKAKKEQQN